jgi:hypothetical protein
MSDDTCSIEGCTRRRSSRGWCNTHYERWRRHGSVDTVLGGRGAFAVASATWTGDNATYPAVHKRLAAYRGTPSGQVCVDCGGHAADWSYDYGSASERTDDQGRVYSVDLASYSPRCKQCHKVFDLLHGKGLPPLPAECLHGHPYLANLVVRAGGRACRECLRLRERRRHASRKARLADTPISGVAFT